jgi:hypothetical protein
VEQAEPEGSRRDRPAALDAVQIPNRHRGAEREPGCRGDDDPGERAADAGDGVEHERPHAEHGVLHRVAKAPQRGVAEPERDLVAEARTDLQHDRDGDQDDQGRADAFRGRRDEDGGGRRHAERLRRTGTEEAIRQRARERQLLLGRGGGDEPAQQGCATQRQRRRDDGDDRERDREGAEVGRPEGPRHEQRERDQGDRLGGLADQADADG